jgi:hypothetical protein
VKFSKACNRARSGYAVAGNLFCIAALSVIAAFSNAFAQPAKIDFDCSVNLGVLQRFEQHQTALTGLGTKDKELCRGIPVKYIRLFAWLGGGYHTDPALHADYIDEFILCIYYKDGGSLQDVSDYDKYEQRFESRVRELKNKWPRKLTYIEVDNEPGINKVCGKPCSYYKYERAVPAIERINADLPAGVPKIKVGGLTANNIGTTAAKNANVYGFLDFCVEKNLRLDFFTWHNYNDKPISCEIDGKLVRAELDKRGYTEAELVVTERHLGGTGAGSNFAQNYYFYNGGLDISTHWVLKGHHRESRNYLRSGDGNPYPSFTMLQMMAMQKKYRFRDASDDLNENGLGMGGVATMDETGLAVLLWSHQSSKSQAEINIVKMPEAFNKGTIKVKHFHSGSNGLVTLTHPDLTPRTSHKQVYEMKGGEVQILILEPSEPVSGTWEATNASKRTQTNFSILSNDIGTNDITYTTDILGRLVPAGNHMPQGIYLSHEPGKTIQRIMPGLPDKKIAK